jgi:filamentous hemagglutinin
LATTTGGTITYAQPNGAGNGIGATITTTGSFNLIDTGNVQTLGTRILVKDEGNAVLNGVYTWSNATVITRSIDADEYGVDSAQALSLNSYFFTAGGNVNKGSAYVVAEPSGTITFGSSNIVFDLFSTSQVYSANTQAGISLVGTVFSAKVDNNTTAFDGGGNISVKAGANLTTPNIGAATGTSLNVTGNVDGGNLNTGGAVSATGNVNSGNVNTGIVSASGNITGGNLLTSGSGGAISGSGNITGGNLLTGGLISATGNVNSGNVNTGIVSASGNVAAAGFTGGNVSVTGNVIAQYFIGNISGNIDAAGANTQVQFNDNDLLGASANFTFNTATNVLSVTGTVQGTTVSATGNVIGGNVSTTGLITATGNITGGNVNTAGSITATGNIVGSVINATSQLQGVAISVTGNVTGGNVISSGAISATGNITGGNLQAAGLSLSGNVVSALNMTTNITTTGNITANNIAATTSINIAGAVAATVDDAIALSIALG